METQPTNDPLGGDGRGDPGPEAAFGRMRFRGLLGHVLLFGLGLGGLAYLLAVVGLDVEPTDPLPLQIYMSFIYLAALLWIARGFRRRGVDPAGILGPQPDARLLPESFAIVFALLLFSMGCLMAVYYPLLSAGGGGAGGGGEQGTRDGIREIGLLTGAGSEYPGAALALAIFNVVILAPFVEELVFRGFLLHRWTVKWNLRAAVLVSSLLFALGHPSDLAGKYLFGVMMAFLYLRTGSLFLPIFCHMLHNGVAMLLLPPPGAPPPPLPPRRALPRGAAPASRPR